MSNQEQKDKVLKSIAKRKGITVQELEDEILADAIDELASRELKNIVKTIKDEKVQDANSYNPSDDEIMAYLDKELKDKV